MKKICSNGFKLSNADKKALEHYLAVTPQKWAQDALSGMIYRAIQTIMNDYYEIYKSKQTDYVSTDLTTVLKEITQMVEFKPYNIQTPVEFDKIERNDQPETQRDDSRILEVWQDGFDIEDFELLALQSFYVDPEGYLNWSMENKIYRRKNHLVKEIQAQMLADPETKTMPARHDALIHLYTSKPSYKNRTQRDIETSLMMQVNNETPS